MEGSLKKQIVTAVQPVFLYTLVYYLTGLGQVNAIQMLHNLFNYYREIDWINLEENAVKIMGPYDPSESLACLIKQLEKGR